MSTSVQDDAFEAFAKQAEAEAKARQQRGGGQQQGQRNYVDIAWSGLERDRMKLIRAVGGPPDSGLDETTARSTRVAWFIGDGKKKFRVVLPERSDDPDHIIWQIISKVKSAEWVNKKKIFPIQEKYPQIYQLVTKNGFKEGDPQFMFDRGWEGRQVLLMNIIDREQQEWHKENKHTMLLSRNVGTDAEGRTYPEDGVPSYGFTSQLANLFKYYKSWEKYDIGITRTGLKESPYRIINASKYFEEVPSDLQEFVSTDPLTEEELAYERYNLDQLYRVTTYTKIFNRLKSKIAIIDATLGTKYLSEMEYAVEKEKETFTQLYGNSAEATEDGEVDETPKPSVVVEKAIPTSSALDDLEADTSSQPLPAAMTRTRTKVNAAPDFDVRYLKGWDKLSQEEKDSIIGITVKNEQVVDIKYKDPTWTLLRCPECSTPSPEHFSHCPACGSPF